MVRLKALKQRVSSLLENTVERLQDSAPIQGLLPLTNPNNYSFTADLNWVPPWDCERNPNSPLCGGKPWSIPLGFRFDFAQDECNTSVELDTTIFAGRGPQLHFNYRAPNCFVEQSFPPFPVEELEEEEKEEEEDEEPPEEPQFKYFKPNSGIKNKDDPPKCTNDCGALFRRYLTEEVTHRREVRKAQERRSKKNAEDSVRRIYESPAAPGNGQFYCDTRRDELYEIRNAIGDFISPQYWEVAEPEEESRRFSDTSYFRLFEAPSGAAAIHRTYYRDGHWKGFVGSTAFNLPDCSCLLKVTTKTEIIVLGRWITRQCYPIVYKPFPIGGKVLGTADTEPSYSTQQVIYDLFTLEESGLPAVFASSAPYPEEPEPPPPFVRKRCRKSCSCTKDLSPVMSGILAQLNQIKERLQEE